MERPSAGSALGQRPSNHDTKNAEYYATIQMANEEEIVSQYDPKIIFSWNKKIRASYKKSGEFHEV